MMRCVKTLFYSSFWLFLITLQTPLVQAKAVWRQIQQQRAPFSPRASQLEAAKGKSDKSSNFHLPGLFAWVLYRVYTYYPEKCCVFWLYFFQPEHCTNELLLWHNLFLKSFFFPVFTLRIPLIFLLQSKAAICALTLHFRTITQSKLSVLIERDVCQTGVPLPLILLCVWVTDWIIN